MDDDAYFRAMLAALDPAYLTAEDLRGQSGFSGDPARWARARSVIAKAIDQDGTFLDVGCANGLLMESIQYWAAALDRAVVQS